MKTYKKQLNEYIKSGKYGSELVDLLDIEVKLNRFENAEEIRKNIFS